MFVMVNNRSQSLIEVDHATLVERHFKPLGQWLYFWIYHDFTLNHTSILEFHQIPL